MAGLAHSVRQAIWLHNLRWCCFSSHLRPYCPVQYSFCLANNKSRSPVSIIRTCTSYFSTIVQESEFEYDGLRDEAGTKERENALRQALSCLASDFGRESMLSLRRFFSSRREPVISTGSLKLDLALGIGGLPKGRIVEIYGQEASGKTMLALHIIKEAQKIGGYCAYFDVENAMDPSLAESMGVDAEKLLLLRPNSAENLLSAVDTLTKSGSLDVIVVDSVAALVPQQEIDNSLGSSESLDRDVQSRIMTQALRRIHSSLSQSETLIVFVNQVRFVAKYGQASGHLGETTCGGNALRFYAAVRLRLARRELMKRDDEAVGIRICVQVLKNKLAPNMKKAELGILFGRGFDSGSEVFELACEHGIILRAGSNYIIDGKVFRDRDEAQSYLAEHDSIIEKMSKLLRQEFFES